MSSVSENEHFVTLTLPNLPAMLRAATAMLGAQDAEDAAQEAIARAWRARSTFRDEQAMRSWLLRITVNVCREWCRGHYGQSRQTTPLPERADEAPEVLALPPGSIDHAGALDLRRAVNELPADLRLLVVLRYYGGLDSSELGAALGLPAATVRTRLRRALKMLRADLDPSPGSAVMTRSQSEGR
jgi:RNA polymerase sigma-70 factor (ECF subfamily)